MAREANSIHISLQVQPLCFIFLLNVWMIVKVWRMFYKTNKYEVCTFLILWIHFFFDRVCHKNPDFYAHAHAHYTFHRVMDVWLWLWRRHAMLSGFASPRVGLYQSKHYYHFDHRRWTAAQDEVEMHMRQEEWTCAVPTSTALPMTSRYKYK